MKQVSLKLDRKIISDPRSDVEIAQEWIPGSIRMAFQSMTVRQQALLRQVQAKLVNELVDFSFEEFHFIQMAFDIVRYAGGQSEIVWQYYDKFEVW